MNALFFYFTIKQSAAVGIDRKFIDDGLKENSKPRKEKLKTGYARENSTMIVKRKVRPRVKTCYHNFFLHKIIFKPSYKINELIKDFSDFFLLYILLLDLSFKISTQEQALRKNGI